MLNLNFKDRTNKENTDFLRESGVVPAVMYGKKTESTPISVALNDFQRVWHEVGESSVISLVKDGETYDVLIHDVEVHPVTELPLHIDFYTLEKGQKVEVSIPLSYVGESPAVKNLGGLLIKVMHELEVEAEAAQLPNEIEVDISTLVDFDSRITVGDLKLPTGVIAKVDKDEVIVIAEEAKEMEEEDTPTEVDISSIEVEKKGKEESEDSSEE